MLSSGRVCECDMASKTFELRSHFDIVALGLEYFLMWFPKVGVLQFF